MLQRNTRYLCFNIRPGSQQVMNAWASSNDYWFMMLTQQGYIVACRWKRNGYKELISKVTQLELGKYK
jgi:dipeptidyl-peptidase-4